MTALPLRLVCGVDPSKVFDVVPVASATVSVAVVDATMVGVANAVAATVSVTPKTDEPGLWVPEIKRPWARKAPTSTETPTKHRSTIPTAGNRDKEQ